MKGIFIAVFLCCGHAQALCPPLLPEPVRIKLHHNQPAADTEIVINEMRSGEQQLQLWDLLRGGLRAQLDLAAVGLSAKIQAQPLIEDINLDGLADHLWLMDTEGRLWRLPLQEALVKQPTLMADLSDSGLEFIATAGLLRARLPSTLAPLAWRQADQQLVLLIGRDKVTGHDSLLMLRFALNQLNSYVIRFNQLVDRTVFSEAEQAQTLAAADWRALLSNAGWQLQLPGKISTKPKVVAGVIYAPVAATKQPDECVSDESAQALYALQLHTAGQVYAKRSQQIPYIPDAKLTLTQQADKSLALELRLDEQSTVLLSNLLKISKECHNCTEPLSLDKFPLWQRLATYRSEQGAY